jgi:hypothetical protein
VTSCAASTPPLPMPPGQTRRSAQHCTALHDSDPLHLVPLNQTHAVQVAGFMRWRLQQLHSEGSENPAQVLSTARNAIRRVRMVMRGLPQRELTEEGKRLIGSVQHEATQETKQTRMRCASCITAQADGAQQHSWLPACCSAAMHCHTACLCRVLLPSSTGALV